MLSLERTLTEWIDDGTMGERRHRGDGSSGIENFGVRVDNCWNCGFLGIFNFFCEVFDAAEKTVN